MRRLLTGLILVLCGALSAHAKQHSFTWHGELRFNPSVPVPGGTLGSLLAEISGRNDLNGVIPVSGRIVYDDQFKPTAMNQAVAGFRDAVVEMSVQFGLVPLQADLPRIAQNADSSHIGVLTMGGGFCSDTEHCQALGVVGPSWGNMMLLHNSTGHFFIDETGTSTQFGDLFGAAVARTDAPTEFLPQIQTQNHGLVAIGGHYLAFFANEGRDFFADHGRLPTIEIFSDWTLVGRTEVILFLELPGQSAAMRIEGIVHGIEIPN